METSRSAGGVVLNSGKVVVVFQDGHTWSLPKGHLDPGETALQAAKREIVEETGLRDFGFVCDLGVYERFRMNKDGSDNTNFLKNISMFLFKTSQTDLCPVEDDVTEARWVPIEEVEALLTHAKDRAFFRGVKKVLYKNC